MHFLFYAFILITCVQLVFYVIVFSHFFKIAIASKAPVSAPVSIVICAQNEAANLKAFLPFILNQSFAEFEIVLVNDRSYDGTLDVMSAFQKQHPDRIKIVNVSATKNGGSKKYALSLGIKAATYEHLVFTDADCTPVSKDWLRHMTSGFDTDTSIVLGYGAYEHSSTLLNTLIRYETLMTALQYYSYAEIGIPYMGVGRNLAYTKSLFFEGNGFAKHLHITSGDDDLFVNQNATKTNTNAILHPSSFTVSTPKTSFKDWIRQKRRHTSTAQHYKPLHQLLLGLFYTSQLLFWGLGLVLLINLFTPSVVLVLIFAKLICQYTVLYKVTQRLHEPGLIIWAPFLELLLILMHLFIFIKNLIKKPTHW